MTTNPLHLDVNQQIECARTLASRFYTDPAILEIERDKIFRRTWQLVGTLDEPCGEVNGVKKTISDPESFFTADVAGEPIIVVRDKDGTLRAFSNVCRHRAGPIALGSGCKNILRCQYHGWTYTLDGKLIGTPDVEGVEFFDRSTMGMFPLRVDTWEKFIFVNLPIRAPVGTANRKRIPPESLPAYGVARRQSSARSPSKPAAFNSPDYNLPSAATTSSIATGRCMSTTISRATTFPSPIPA